MTRAQTIEKPEFRLSVPGGWKAMPELEEAIRGAMLSGTKDLEAGVAAWGDASQGIFTMVLWVTSPDGGASVRDGLMAFHGGIRETLEQDGSRITSWELSETPTRLVSHVAATSDDNRVRGVAIAGMDKDRAPARLQRPVHRRRQGRARPPSAQAILDTFQVTLPDANLRSLGPKP